MHSSAPTWAQKSYTYCPNKGTSPTTWHILPTVLPPPLRGPLGVTHGILHHARQFICGSYVRAYAGSSSHKAQTIVWLPVVGARLPCSWTYHGRIQPHDALQTQVPSFLSGLPVKMRWDPYYYYATPPRPTDSSTMPWHHIWRPTRCTRALVGHTQQGPALTPAPTPSRPASSRAE